MSSTVEVISKLERRMTVTVPMQSIEEEVSQRIKQYSRTAKMPGFRPGKVPAKIVEQQYGAQARNEAMTNAVERSFSESVAENKLRIAGYPNIEQKPFNPTDKEFQYVATFEVFPEVEMGDLSKVKIEKPVLEVTEADVKRTIDVLVKQRVTFSSVKRASKEGDKVSISFTAHMDGKEVESTGDRSIDLVLGEGGRIAEFDAQITGEKSGAQKKFDIKYPKDHKPEQLAGKKVSYDLTIKDVAEPVLPKVDKEFAKALGVADGSLDVMNKEIKESLEQEVAKRVSQVTKEQVFEALVKNAKFEVPHGLVAVEMNRLMQVTAQNLQQRGVDLNTVKLEPAMFEEQAKRGTLLRLILAEIVNKNNLQANADQIRAMVDQFSNSYEKPQEVVDWYYADASRLDEPAALATEQNVVDWVLKTAKVTDKKVKFEEFMSGQPQS
jgi:trigger factor